MNEENIPKVPHGRWRENPYTLDNKVSLMPLDFLHSIRGNDLGKTDVNELKQNISNNGLNEPLILSFDPKQNAVTLGEGNHRTKALSDLGFTHAPVRGLRSSVSPQNGQSTMSHDFTPFKDWSGYIPSDISPAKLGLPGQHFEVEKPIKGEAAQKLKIEKYRNSNNEKWVEEHPGRPTAKHDRLLKLPVKWLKTLPGLRGEHKVLTYDMDKIQGMSEIVGDNKWQRANPVTLGVQHDGKIFVDDGNHRIRAAVVAKIDTLLCRVMYFGGGEDEFDLSKILDKYASLDIESYMSVVASRWSKSQWCRGNECGRPASGGGLFCTDCSEKKRNPDFKTKPPTDKIDWVDPQTQKQLWKAQANSAIKVLKLASLFHSLGVKQSHVAALEIIAMDYPEVNKSISNWNEDIVNKVKHNIDENEKIKLKPDMDVAAYLVRKLIKQADGQGISGDVNVDGEPADGEYAGMHDAGVDYAGENDPNKGDERTMIKGQNDGVAAEASIRNLKPGELDVFKSHMQLDDISPDKLPIAMDNPTAPTHHQRMIDVEPEDVNRFEPDLQNYRMKFSLNSLNIPAAYKLAKLVLAIGVDNVTQVLAPLNMKKTLKSNPEGKITSIENIDSNPTKGTTIDVKAGFTDKEHRKHDHIKESEMEQGKSKKEADEIAWSTVQKQKKEAATMAPSMQGVSRAKPSFMDKLKPEHKNIIHRLVNNFYTPGFDDVNPPDDNPLNLKPGQRLASVFIPLFRAALVNDGVLDVLINQASSNGCCQTCGNKTDSCLCADDTNMGAGYTQSGTQRKIGPAKTKSSSSSEFNPSKGLGKL